MLFQATSKLEWLECGEKTRSFTKSRDSFRFRCLTARGKAKYPKIYKSWHEKWALLATYFKYPLSVRRLIYTTNTIEGFNRQLRKVTKSKTIFPSDDSLLKMLYLAMIDITKKWTGRRQDWSQIRAQLEIYFEERLCDRNI